MSTASEIELLAQASHQRIQLMMNKFRPVVDGMILKMYGAIMYSDASRIVASRNLREGRYAGFYRSVRDRNIEDHGPKRRHHRLGHSGDWEPIRQKKSPAD